ncbi:conjugative transposon protein TraN [Pontibacter qinzhouensis]|uniref:Conjugative transposon protein TraN n=1 Tax=Pontibacter qinzhouensis TaxID=2603253 RepID=A0A5C8J5E8_9BACT|nr:conjugative transposon protein TraN [Pontibacter qinzhouensis]TXK31123.1 conjugative transposon protein TraN [Pontibacter qinzhouensis]
MKKNLFLCLLLLQLTATAQDLQPKSLELAYQKTTTLVFPHTVQSVDRGSRDILAQVPEKVENVLQLKAAQEGFTETNLTVITADGRLYSFEVTYADHPATTLLKLGPPASTDAPVEFANKNLNTEQLKTIANLLAEDPRYCYGIKDKAGKTKTTLEGIYVQGNTFFYRLVLSNKSPIPYDVDFVRFSLRDRRQVKRTATQEEERIPLYAYGLEEKTVEAGGQKTLVFALEKVPITKEKELVVELFEKNGGRHLQLRIRGKDLEQACALLL